jgi:chemotaxis family two-component system sensor kinase Cph1
MPERTELEQQTGPRVVAALRGAPPAEALDALARQRARQFLQSQTGIIVFALAVTSIARMSGLMSVPIARRYLGACAVTALITALGWALLQKVVRPRQLILGMLVVDALVGYPAVYWTGGLGTPAAAGVLLCLPMTPVFAGKQHLPMMAALHWVVYSAMLYFAMVGNWAALMPPFLHPGPVAASLADAVANWIAFTVVCFGMAFVIRIPALDIAVQRELLSDIVHRNTQALERTSNKLALANNDLAGLNSQLQQANTELVAVNADLAVVVKELEVVNDQLGLSNSELARANTELEHTNDALQRSNERLDQFNTAVSHDLRAPLQAIMARAELAALAAHTDPSRVARMADQICDSATRMARQLDEMYKLSRLEDRLESVESVPLGALLGEVVQDLELKVRSRRVNLEVVHPLPRFTGSRGLLAELFLNLIDNAIKYGDAERPRVRVMPVETEPGWVAAAVEDNGLGIPEDQRDRVFQLFRRLTRDQDVEGLGAGLAIVRRIVNVHGGVVSIDQGPVLGGARFIVRMPDRSNPEPMSASQSVRSRSGAEGASTVTGPGEVAEA